MALKYFFARLKRNFGLTVMGSLALFLVCITLIIATAMPAMLNDSLLDYNRQLCGNADLMLSNSNDTKDRFFGLTALRSDSDLTKNAEYINGYFMAFAELKINSPQGDFCTLFAADYQKQNDYNPILSDDLPENITDSDIIIGKNYAVTFGIITGDIVKISFVGKDIPFRVVCIAENKGLFNSANAVFISSKALSRFIPFLGSEIVTHCFIKAKDNASLSIISAHLKAEYDYLSVKPAIQIDEVRNTTIPLVFVSVLIVIFCAISLAVLLRLIFNRDKANFELFRALGMPKKRIKFISILSSLTMCLFAFIAAVGVALFVESYIRAKSTLFSALSIGALPYIVGIPGGLLISIICTLLSTREAGAGTNYKKAKPKKIFSIDSWLIFLGFTILTALSYFVIDVYLYAGLLLAIAGLLGVIMFLPKTIGKIYAGIYTRKQNIYTLRLKSLTKKPDWQKFALFVTLGLTVILLLITTAASIRINIQNAISNQVDIKYNGEVLGKSELASQNLAAFIFADYLWMLDICSGSLIFLTAITSIFIIIIRRLAFIKETRKLTYLGLNKSADLLHNAFSIALSLLPILIFGPLIVLVICKISGPLFSLFNAKINYNYNFLTIFQNALFFIFFIFVAEIAICFSLFKTAQKDETD